MLKNKLRMSGLVMGVMAVSLSMTACGNNTTATDVTPSSTTEAAVSTEDIDAIVEKRVQEQLEIDRRVKESVEAAKAQETEATTVTETTTSTNSGTYLLPFSNERLVTAADLASLSKDQLRFARNEIFARHGRIFKSDDLNNYFKSQSWYTPSVPADQFKESVLSKVESDNVARISNYEKNGTVDAKPMQIKSGTYEFRDWVNDGDATFTVTVRTEADWPIYFEYNYTDNYHPATEYFGYMTDMGNGTYLVTESTGTDEISSMNDSDIMTIKMISNGFQDVATGNVYKYSSN